MQKRLFGRYCLGRKVGSGGMAEVYKGKFIGSKGFSKTVALKITPRGNAEIADRFVDEAKCVSRLNHPNIVHISDFREDNNGYYIIMEYIRGKDLNSVMERGINLNNPVPLVLASYIVSSVCQGLEYAHTLSYKNKPLNLVHRDITPQNILISYEGDVKLVDFGIAKLSYSKQNTEKDTIKGKVAYMSPEQAMGQSVDKRSDIFSLGIIFYELLTGKNLFFREKDPVLTLEQVRKAEFVPASGYGVNIPDKLEMICKKALAKEVEERYSTAYEMQMDIESYLYKAGNRVDRIKVNQYMHDLFVPEIYREDEEDAKDVRIEEGDDLAPIETKNHSRFRQSISAGLEKRKSSGISFAVLFLAMVFSALIGFYIFEFVKTGRIMVETIPEKADIFLNKKKVGSSGPIQLDNLKIGVRHTLSVSSKGYKKWSKTFILEGKNARLFEVELEKRTARLEVTVTDRFKNKEVSALLYLDERLVGESPLSIEKIDVEQDHTLLVSSAGYRSVKRAVTFKDADEENQAVVIAVDLYPNTGKAGFYTDKGEKVFTINLNGEERGDTPLDIFGLLLGFPYKVVASADGFENFILDFTLKNNKVKRFRIESQKIEKTVILKRGEPGTTGNKIKMVSLEKTLLSNRERETPLDTGTDPTNKNIVKKRLMSQVGKSIQIKKPTFSSVGSIGAHTGKNKITTIQADLQIKKGSMEIVVNRPGTEIFVNNKLFVKTNEPYELVSMKDLPPGEYRVTGKLKDFNTVELPIKVISDFVSKTQMDMISTSEVIIIRTHPPGAKMFIDDKAEGTSPLEIPIKINGVYRIRAEGVAGHKAENVVIEQKKMSKETILIHLTSLDGYGHYLEGIEAERKYDITLRNILSGYSDNIERRLNRHFKNCINSHLMAIKADPHYSPPYNGLGRIYYKRMLGLLSSEKYNVDELNEFVQKGQDYSWKVIELNNNSMAYAAALVNIGNIKFGLGELEQDVEQKLKLYQYAITFFDKGISGYKKNIEKPEFKISDIEQTYFNRAMSFEKIAENSDGSDEDGREDACKAWQIYNYPYRDNSQNPFEPKRNSLHKKALQHLRKFCS